MTRKFAWRALTLIIGLAMVLGVITLPVATPQLHVEAQPASAQACGDSWEAHYFNDTNFTNLVWVDCILPDVNGWLDDDFSNQFIPTTNFTATYQRQVNFVQTGIYIFNITVEDGIRVYVNGQLVVDAWGDSAGPRVITQQVNITQPISLVYVEYLMTGTNAELSLHWYEPESLVASAGCNGPDLEVTISAGDGPFDITASAGINMPVNGVTAGTITINGPEKWDDLTVTETVLDYESLNLGQFKCRTDERPIPVWPPHRYHTTNDHPYFEWSPITDANNYRVRVWDGTVDIRQNSGGPTNLTLSQALSPGRYFWRVRGRQNRVWSLWSVRFTLFVDPVVIAPEVQVNVPALTVELSSPLPPNGPPDSGPPPTDLPAPPNSR